MNLGQRPNISREILWISTTTSPWVAITKGGIIMFEGIRRKKSQKGKPMESRVQRKGKSYEAG
jgi:hypothetical protein